MKGTLLKISNTYRVYRITDTKKNSITVKLLRILKLSTPRKQSKIYKKLHASRSLKNLILHYLLIFKNYFFTNPTLCVLL